jgi:hypothetical protein
MMGDIKALVCLVFLIIFVQEFYTNMSLPKIISPILIATIVSLGSSCSSTSSDTPKANENTDNTANGDIVIENGQGNLGFQDREVLGGIRVGDFNNDSYPDLAIPLREIACHSALINSRFYIKFLFGDSTGQFPASIEKDTSSTSFSQAETAMISADFNNDVFDDLFQLEMEHPVFYIGKPANDLDLAFTYIPTTSPIYVPGASKPIDINQDGYLDIIGLVTHGSVQYHFAYQLNNQDNTFGKPQEIIGLRDLSVNLGFSNFIIDDFDGDNRDDILAIGKEPIISKFHLVFFKNEPNNSFTIPNTTSELALDIAADSDIFNNVSKDLAAADFDEDGDLDIAITSTTSFLEIMLNDGNGNFSAGNRVTVGSQPVKVIAADFNKDGHIDLVSSNNKSETLFISFGVGDGTFGDKNSIPDSWKEYQLAGNNLKDMQVADFDQDGYLDIVTAESGSRDSAGETCTAGSVQFIYSPGI